MDYKEKLRSIKQKISGLSLPLSPKLWEKDGVDHINVWVYSDTKLGRALALDRANLWEHPLLGSFLTVEAIHLMGRAKERNEEFRLMKPYELRKTLSNNTGKFHSRTSIPNLNVCLIHSAYIRMLSDPLTVRMMLSSELPFDHYWRERKQEGVPTRYSRREHYTWICAGYEEIRTSLKEGRLPNFDSLKSHPEESIYSGVLPKFLDEDIDFKEIDEALDTYTLENLSKVLEQASKPIPKRTRKPRPNKKTKQEVTEKYVEPVDSVEQSEESVSDFSSLSTLEVTQDDTNSSVSD